MISRIREQAQPYRNTGLGGGSYNETGSFAGNNKSSSKEGRIKKGPITMATGAVYEGEWRDNKRDG